jgi:hypothetical protein
MKLRQFILSATSAALFGVAGMVHAADAMTTAEIRTTVVEPTNIRATYSVTDNLTVGNLTKGARFGTLMLEGHKVQTTFADIHLSDNTGGKNLTLRDNTGHSLEYTVAYPHNGMDVHPVINGHSSNSPSTIAPEQLLMFVQLASEQNNIPAGNYTGTLNISISNQ